MADARVQTALGVEFDPRGFGAFLQMLCGIFPPGPLGLDMARWEDDGGPPAPDPVNYTHTFRSDATPFMRTTTEYLDGEGWDRRHVRFEGGGERLLTSKRTGPPATSPASPAPHLTLEEYDDADDAGERLYQRLGARHGHRFVFRRRYATEREQRRDEILQRAEAARRRYCQRQGHTRVALLGFEPYCLRCRVSRPDLPR